VNGHGGGNNFSTSENPQISGDGRYVVFDSNAVNLAANDNNNAIDTFAYDRTTGKTTLVSVNQSGTGSGNGASPPSFDGYLGPKLALSSSGGLVAFVSQAGNLVAGDNNASGDVLTRNLSAGTTTLASTRSPAMPAAYMPHGGSGDPSISADGRYITFDSTASDIVPNDNNYPARDVFVRDRVAGTTTLVSVNKGGTATGNKDSYNPVTTPDGRYVLFQSKALRPDRQHAGQSQRRRGALPPRSSDRHHHPGERGRRRDGRRQRRDLRREHYNRRAVRGLHQHRDQPGQRRHGGPSQRDLR
jgi:Tol biopolymer transport system component